MFESIFYFPTDWYSLIQEYIGPFSTQFVCQKPSHYDKVTEESEGESTEKNNSLTPDRT